MLGVIPVNAGILSIRAPDSLFRGNDRLGRKVVRAVQALDDFSLKNTSAAVGFGLFGEGGRICEANALWLTQIKK